jgi:membrane associated rhomboid family serine protease
MIPLRDTNPARTRPVVTFLLVAVNLVVFLYEVSLGKRAEIFFRQFGVVPVDIVDSLATGRFSDLRPLVTSMFLHAGWLHLIGNMLFLWVFGDNVEDRLGHLRFLVFYLASGLVATAAHVGFNAGSTVVTIGASGAVAGVLGGYAFLFPGARVLALVPLGFFIQTMELPARLFLGFWFVIQFFSGATALAVAGGRSAGGVAWWAHIGGFAFGLLVALVFYRRQRADPAHAW